MIDEALRVIEIMRTCHDLTARACTEGKYRKNQTPYIAALSDEDMNIRTGACSIIMSLVQQDKLYGSLYVLKVLKQHRGREEHTFVCSVMDATIRDVEEYHREKTE